MSVGTYSVVEELGSGSGGSSGPRSSGGGGVQDMGERSTSEARVDGIYNILVVNHLCDSIFVGETFNTLHQVTR